MNSLAYLLDVYGDGSISEEEAVDLIARLEADPKLLIEVKESLEIHGLIHEYSNFDPEADDLVEALRHTIDFNEAPNEFEKSILLKVKQQKRWRQTMLALAASIVVIMGFWLWKNDRQAIEIIKNDPEKKLLTEPALAEIIAEDHAEWRQIRDGEEMKSSLFRGSYKLLKGSAVLKTPSGSIIALTAPVEFELLNSERLLLNQGEVGIRVAQGGTFSVDTSEMLIVDLGTEFSVRKSASKTSIFVFEGEVGVFTTKRTDESKADSLRLKEGSGLEYAVNQGFVKVDNNSSALQRASDIHQRFTVKEYFVIKLAGNEPLYKLVLHNYGQEELGYNYYSKDFTIQISEGSTAAFTTVLEGTLEARTGPQEFKLDNIEGRYIKLIIKSGYQEGFLELSEIEVYNSKDRNVASSKEGGKLFGYHSDYPFEIDKGHWVAANIIDGKTRGHASDSWSSNGKTLFDEFLTIDLTGKAAHTIDRLIIYNYGQEEEGYNYYSKDFIIMVSTTSNDRKAFRQVYKGVLKASPGPQAVELVGVEARYIKIIISSGYRTGFVQLAELEAYSGTQNVAAAEGGGRIIDFSSHDSRHIKRGVWAADNIIDGEKSGHKGSWSSKKLRIKN